VATGSRDAATEWRDVVMARDAAMASFLRDIHSVVVASAAVSGLLLWQQRRTTMSHRAVAAELHDFRTRNRASVVTYLYD